jgi:flagellar basal-body rod modification protein FlgD
MSVSATTGTQSTSSTTAATVTNSSSQLTESDFLNLLVSQLENQDPLNPESDTDFASQMAQFSSLTGMDDLNSSFGQLYGVSLLGTYVNATDTSTDTSYSGQVTGTSTSDGTNYVTVNGTSIPTSWITSVSDSSSSSSSSTTS